MLMHEQPKCDFEQQVENFSKALPHVPAVRQTKLLTPSFSVPASPANSDRPLDPEISDTTSASPFNFKRQASFSPTLKEIKAERVEIVGLKSEMMENYTENNEEVRRNSAIFASLPNEENVQHNLEDHHRRHLFFSRDDEPNINESSAVPTSPENLHTVVEMPIQEPSSPIVATSLPTSTENVRTTQTFLFRLLQAAFRKIPQTQPNFTIFRVLTLCTMVGILSLISILTGDIEIPFYPFAVTISIYLGFSILENVVRVQSCERAAWSVREDILNIVDAACGIILLICMQNASIASLIAVAILCGVLPLIYGFLTKTSRVTKIFGITVRFLYAIQALIVMLKLTNYINWEWRLVLVETWIFFALSLPLMMFFSLCLLYHNLTLIAKYFIQQGLYHPDYLNQVCLALWILGYSIMDFLVAMYVFCISLALDNRDTYQLLKIISIIGLILCSVLLLCGRLMFSTFYKCPRLLSFIQIIESPSLEEARTQDEATPQRSRDIKMLFKTIKQTQYFMRSSECYFIPLAAKTLLNHRKGAEKEIKQERYQPTQIKALNNSDFTTPPRLVKLPILNAASKSKELAENRGQCESLILKKASTAPNKYAPIPSIRKQKVVKDDSSCYVCCIRLPNTVMLTCGHGGVCYECAETNIKKKKQCMECRAPVEAIAVIQQETGLEGVYRSSEVIKIIGNVELAPSVVVESTSWVS